MGFPPGGAKPINPRLQCGVGTFRTKIIAIVLVAGGVAYNAAPLDRGRLPAILLPVGTPALPWYSNLGQDMVHSGLLLLVVSFLYDWWRGARNH